MLIYAWNSQGAKYNVFPHFLPNNPALPRTGERFALMLTEAGWPPWMNDGPVTRNTAYRYGQAKLDNTTFGFDSSQSGDLWRFLECGRSGSATWDRSGNRGVWWPWVADTSGKTNARCSAALISDLACISTSMVASGTGAGSDAVRNICLHDFPFQSRNGARTIRVISVHLRASGNAITDFQDLAGVVKAESNAPVDRSMTTLVVGDMNLDLAETGTRNKVEGVLSKTLGRSWGLLDPGAPTQQGGGRLDWGFWYDPLDVGHAWSVRKRTGFHGDGSRPFDIPSAEWSFGTSDHAVIEYRIDESQLR